MDDVVAVGATRALVVVVVVVAVVDGFVGWFKYRPKEFVVAVVDDAVDGAGDGAVGGTGDSVNIFPLYINLK